MWQPQLFILNIFINKGAKDIHDISVAIQCIHLCISTTIEVCRIIKPCSFFFTYTSLHFRSVSRHSNVIIYDDISLAQSLFHLSDHAATVTLTEKVSHGL